MSPGPTFPAAVLALPSPGRARGVRAACRPPLGARPPCDAPARPRRFATQERNALLLYNGRFNEKHDFIALEVVGEQVQLTFSAGRARPPPRPASGGAAPPPGSASGSLLGGNRESTEMSSALLFITLKPRETRLRVPKPGLTGGCT